MFLIIRLFICLTIIRFICCSELCSDHEICPRNKPFCSKAGCVFECTKPFFVNGSYCVSTCGDWFVKNQICLQQCPDNWFVRETLELIGGQAYMKKSCILACDPTEYTFGNICVRACPLNYTFITNRVCSPQCASVKDFVSNFSINSITYHTCVEQCPYFADGIYCTNKCARNKFILNLTCVDECPDRYPLTSRNECVQTCPVTTVYMKDNECLENCTEQKPFFLNGTCIEVCPEYYFITNRNGVIFCENQCQSGEYVYKNTCLHSCAYDGKRDYYLYYLNQTCVEECPPSYFYKRESYYPVGSCVTSCANDELIYNRSCVNSCPEGTYLINQTCVTKCPVNFPLICRVGQDGKCSGAGSRPNTVSHALCVSGCPHNTLILNNSCVAKCPKSYFAFEQECVLECPENFPLLQNGSITYNTWTRYFYNSWRIVAKTENILKCVSECNEGLVNFNNTCVTECPKNYRYIENGSCQANECTTKYMYNTSSNIVCTDSCDFFLYNGKCVTECPNDVFITNKTCHIDQCRTRYTFNTSSVVFCTDDCIQYGFINNEVCDEHCPHYVFNDTCVPTCPKSHEFMVANQTRKIQCNNEQNICQKSVEYTECMDTCPEPLYKYKELCLEICPVSNYISNRTCVNTCPKSHPFHQKINLKSIETNIPDGIDKQSLSSYVCVEQCTYPLYLLDMTDYSCVDICPNTTRYIHFNVCTTGCPKGKLHNEIKQGLECTESCPSNKFVFNGTCVQKCPQNTYNFNNSNCVFECPKSDPFGLTSESWRCIKSCESYELFKSGTCIYESDCSEPFFPFENACVKSCPKGYVWAHGCGRRWESIDAKVAMVSLGLWIFLSILCRRTLKEYFILLSMLLFKVDVRCKKDIDVSDDDDDDDDDNNNEDDADENQIEDDQAFLTV